MEKKDFKTLIVRVKDTLWGDMPENVETLSPYVNTSIFTRVLRKFFSEKKFIQNIINNPKLKNVDADMILVFDSISIAFLNWLKRHNPNKRIVLWYWNPVSLTINPNDVPEGIEKWSYSRKDCEEYGMTFNTQFCFSKYETVSQEPKTDVFFFGRDKGRGDAIEGYQKQLEALGIKTDFRIIRSDKDYIPYEKVIELTCQAKCVLDFCVSEDVGMSLRALEALFLNKKVITNNAMYVYEAFYSPKNVFILGKDDINSLQNFLNEPLQDIAKETKDAYLFENWLTRFYN